MRCAPSDTPDDFDVQALRDRYRAERDKRLRKEGSRQYVHAEGEFASVWEDDPNAAPVTRAPVREDADVVVVGGGFAGLLTGAALKRRGVEDVRIVDMAGDVGGVWYWNRYPGIQCDNESYTYMPLLEEVGYMPARRFADGAEIQRHCRRIAEHFGLYEGALLGTMISAMRWDGDIRRWRVTTHLGDEIRARFVVIATGPWSKPKLPGIPGLDTFAGRAFHSARWDYDYTGGTPDDPVLARLRDKRVAVIGTGATAIQIVPQLARHAAHLTVFQRTPSAVDRRRDEPTDPAWVAGLAPGWQKDRQANFHAFAGEWFPSDPEREDLTCDFFTEVTRNVAGRIAAEPAALPPEELMALREREDHAVMERIRRRVDAIVDDPATAETLKPYYRYMCKRPCSSNTYLEAFNQPNVTLVDVSGSKGVERVTATGLVADGKHYPVDCIIFASGFEVAAQDQAASFGIAAIEGRDGRSLYDHWRGGYRTYHGMSSHGFPGMFFTGFTQAGVAASVTAMYEQQAEHIGYVISQALERGAASIEATREAEDAWVREIRDTSPPDTFLEACTPGYYNNEGGGSGGIRAAVGEPYPAGFVAFGDLLQRWRSDGELAGFALERR